MDGSGHPTTDNARPQGRDSISIFTLEADPETLSATGLPGSAVSEQGGRLDTIAGNALAFIEAMRLVERPNCSLRIEHKASATYDRQSCALIPLTMKKIMRIWIL
jgi:hypothetical protein